MRTHLGFVSTLFFNFILVFFHIFVISHTESGEMSGILVFTYGTLQNMLCFKSGRRSHEIASWPSKSKSEIYTRSCGSTLKRIK